MKDSSTLSLPPVPPPAPAGSPWRDRVLACLFAIAIAWPAVALIWNAKLTTTRFENRAMAPWPKPALSREFPRAFDSAFSDRFGGRDNLVRLHHAGILRVFGVSSLATVMPAKADWYYWLGEDGYSLDRMYRGTREFPKLWITNSAAELKRRHDWLAARGIAYVVVVVPEKYTVYPEFLPDWVAKMRGPTPHDILTAEMAKHPEVPYVDLRDALKAAKGNDRLYYKTDSHWNYNGATVGYGEIMRAVQQALPPGKLVSIAPPYRPKYEPGVDYYRGDLLTMLSLPGGYSEDDVAPLSKVLGDTTSRCGRRIDKGEYPGFEFFVCDRPGLPRLLMLRDSMAIPLIPLLSENFSRAVYVSSREFDRAIVEREKPDIVIEEFVERIIHGPGSLPMKP